MKTGTQNIRFMNAKRGIALLIALGAMIVILVIGSLTIYMITRGLQVAGGQKLYQSAFEACEGGLEIGIAKVDSAFRYGVPPTHDSLGIGAFGIQIQADALFASTVAGAAIKFARGYYGAGQGIAQGGVNLYYLVRTQALGKGGERVTIEIEQKKTVGID